jgi:hypothetical protein
VARHVAAHLEDGEQIALDGRPHDPALLTQGLLETVIDRVGRVQGDWPHDVVLTYPLFPPGGSPALLDRVGQAVAGGALLIPNPVAAVAKLANDVEIAVGTTVAVLDLGGGTFEVTIVRRSHDGFDVVGPPGGLADLGGVEFDDAVFARVDAELGHVLQEVPRDDAEGMAALRRLRVACRAAKEWLSSSPDTTVEVALPRLSTWVPIRRADLESDIRPAPMAAVDAVAQTIAAAELAPADVHVALLVGGSSRIPLFGELVASRLGLPVVADPFPELTVALGAALFGSDGPPPPQAAMAATRDDPGIGARDAGAQPGGDASGAQAGDVGALAAWFADPAGGPMPVPVSAPGPGLMAASDDLPGGPPAGYEPAEADTWDGAESDGAQLDRSEDDRGDWDSAGRDAAERDPTEWSATDDNGWQPEWDLAGGEAPVEAVEWHGGEWTEAVGDWGDTTAVAAAPDRRSGPTTGETDLWGPPSRRRRERRSDGDDDEEPDTQSGEDQDEGTSPRLIAAIIGGALAIVGIAGVALATGMGGADDPQLTLADPAGSEITTTTLATTTEPPMTTTTSITTTTTAPEPEPEPAWEPPPPPSTEPPTTATTTTAPPTTTTTARPTTTTTAPATTTTCPTVPPGPPGGPPTTTTTTAGCG